MTDDLMGAISAEITMRMTETQNAFVMETIIPFLQKRTELAITKEELIDALQKRKQKAVIRRKRYYLFVDFLCIHMYWCWIERKK